jgi:uncharacterized protein YndB with AHSA1/START domain
MITRTVALACTVERAFELFTGQASSWWPHGRRHTPDPASRIVFEPLGRFFERASDGREVELGRVLEWTPPRRLVLDFFIGTGPAEPTFVVVEFAAEAEGSRVTVLHRPRPASQAAWDRRAPAFAASWEALLTALVTYMLPSAP